MALCSVKSTHACLEKVSEESEVKVLCRPTAGVFTMEVRRAETRAWVDVAGHSGSLAPWLPSEQLLGALPLGSLSWDNSSVPAASGFSPQAA